MGIEGSQGNGSMFGVVDSLRNMTSAMEEILRYLPEDFVWPTVVTVFRFQFFWSGDNAITPLNIRQKPCG